MAAVLIREAEFRRRLGGVARSTLFEWQRRGILPAPIRIGGVKGWLSSDADALFERLVAERDARNAQGRR